MQLYIMLHDYCPDESRLNPAHGTGGTLGAGGAQFERMVYSLLLLKPEIET